MPDGTEGTAGDHADAELVVMDLVLGYAVLALVSATLADLRMYGALTLPWLVVLGPVILPPVVMFAAGLWLVARDAWVRS